MRFVLRINFAHPSASSLLNPCLFLKRRIDIQEAVINRMIVSVEQHLDSAVNRVEQRAGPLLRLAQRFAYGGQLFGPVRDSTFEFFRGALLFVQLPCFLQSDRSLICRHSQQKRFGRSRKIGPLRNRRPERRFRA